MTEESKLSAVEAYNIEDDLYYRAVATWTQRAFDGRMSHEDNDAAYEEMKAVLWDRSGSIFERLDKMRAIVEKWGGLE